MPKIQSHTVIDITPEKFLNACDSTELHEVELLLSKAKYQEKMGRRPSPIAQRLTTHKIYLENNRKRLIKDMTVIDPEYLESPRTCHQCGCTDDNCLQCMEKTGEPCHWVAENLCSACAENAEPSKMSKLDGIFDSEGLLIEFAKHLRKEKLLLIHDVTLEGEVGFFLKNIKDNE